MGISASFAFPKVAAAHMGTVQAALSSAAAMFLYGSFEFIRSAGPVVSFFVVVLEQCAPFKFAAICC